VGRQTEGVEEDVVDWVIGKLKDEDKEEVAGTNTDGSILN